MSEAFDAVEFLEGFIAEAEEHLAVSSTNLLAIEDASGKGQATPRQVRDLFRSLHTIKGLAAMVAVEPIVDIAHAMESLLRQADKAGGVLPRGAVALLLNGVNAIDQRVQALGKSQPVAAAPAKLIDALNDLRHVDPPRQAGANETSLPSELWLKLNVGERNELLQGITAGRNAFLVHFLPTPERASQGVTISAARERVGAQADIVKVIPQSVAAHEDKPAGIAFALIVLTDKAADIIAESAFTEAPAVGPIVLLVSSAPDAGEPQPRMEAPPEAAEDGVDDDLRRRGVVRVEVSRLDEALEGLSALVVTQFRLQRAVNALAGESADKRVLVSVVGENGRLLRDLRASIMRARMVPVSEVLERIPLIVRGLSRATGKAAVLSLSTGNTELDKSVAERIFPAIVHLVRNAVDHALEAPDERAAAGKTPTGVVTVACHERSDSQLELTVRDDGRGVDAEAVAKRVGVATPTTNEGLLDLLCRPGLSTKAEVTTTSGRGVGMDVVRRIAVDELRGEFSMTTIRGVGTTFFLRIPLSITIVDAFSFACGGEIFVVPVSMVEEVQEIDTSRTVRGPDRRKAPRNTSDRRGEPRATDMILRRGEAVPLLSLHEILGLPTTNETRRKVILVRRQGEPFGFTVDRMLGQQEVVVRPLQDELVRVHGVSGTTDLGDGKPTLVLDLAALGAKLITDREAVLS